MVEIVNAVKQLAFPLIFLVLGSGGGGDGLFEAAAVAVPLTIAVARFLSTRYAIDGDAVYLRQGVIQRKEQIMPRRNVQNVATRAQLIARMTNLVELQISDASAEGDINLRLLSQAESDRIATMLRETSDQFGVEMIEGTDGVLRPAPPRDPIVATTSRDLVLASIGHGLSVGSMVTTGLMLVGLLFMISVVGFDFFTENLFVLIGAVPLLLLTVPARIVLPVVRLAGFKLWADPDRLRSEAGMFTQQKTAARRERVQLVQIDRQAMLRKLGLERVRFATADLEGFDGAAVTYLSPGSELGTWPRLGEEALGVVELHEDQLHQVSPLTKRRVFVRFVVAAVLVFVAAVVAAVLGYVAAAGIAVAGAAALVLFGDIYSRRRYARLGWVVADTQLFCRTGAFDETLKIIRKEKVQSLRVEQTWFQRRLNLASIHVGTAGSAALGSVDIPDMALEDALGLANHLTMASAATPLSATI